MTKPNKYTMVDAYYRAKAKVGQANIVNGCLEECVNPIRNSPYDIPSPWGWGGNGKAWAINFWLNAVAKGKVVKTSKTNEIPAGALTFMIQNAYVNSAKPAKAGHVFIGAGAGYAYSTDRPSSGKWGRVTIASIQRDWGMTLLGYVLVTGDGYDLQDVPVDSVKDTDKYTVTASALNGRTYPRTDATIVWTAPKDHEVVAKAKTTDGKWIQSTAGYWYSAQYLASTTPPTATKPADSTPADPTPVDPETPTGADDKSDPPADVTDPIEPTPTQTASVLSRFLDAFVRFIKALFGVRASTTPSANDNTGAGSSDDPDPAPTPDPTPTPPVPLTFSIMTANVCATHMQPTTDGTAFWTKGPAWKDRVAPIAKRVLDAGCTMLATQESGSVAQVNLLTSTLGSVWVNVNGGESDDLRLVLHYRSDLYTLVAHQTITTTGANHNRVLIVVLLDNASGKSFVVCVAHPYYKDGSATYDAERTAQAKALIASMPPFAPNPIFIVGDLNSALGDKPDGFGQPLIDAGWIDAETLAVTKTNASVNSLKSGKVVGRQVDRLLVPVGFDVPTWGVDLDPGATDSDHLFVDASVKDVIA